VARVQRSIMAVLRFRRRGCRRPPRPGRIMRREGIVKPTRQSFPCLVRSADWASLVAVCSQKVSVSCASESGRSRCIFRQTNQMLVSLPMPYNPLVVEPQRVKSTRKPGGQQSSRRPQVDGAALQSLRRGGDAESAGTGTPHQRDRHAILRGTIGRGERRMIDR
jgi:hypothetical protein